jgi:hypothetical protein
VVHCAHVGGGRNKVSKASRGSRRPNKPRLNARSALLGLFVALTIVLASTTVYESGIRTTLTSTSTSTSTLTSTVTQTTTVTPTTRLTTSTLFSYVFGAPAAFVLNSSDGLSLSIQVKPSLDGNYTITVRESNLLNSVNNVTEAYGWKYRLDSMSPCGARAYVPLPVGAVVQGPMIFAVVQGIYGQNNYTSSKPLPFYNTGDAYTCGEETATASSYEYAFQPLSDAYFFPSASTSPGYGVASVTISTNGYWTGGQGDVAAAFKTFSPGYYTVIGADEWGNVVLLQFSVP